MTASLPAEAPLARLTLRARTELVAPARDFARAIAALQGFAAPALARLELLTEEACLFVVEHGFEPGEEGTFDVILHRQPGKLVVAVEDKGLPIDFSRPPQDSTLGLTLMRGFAEEIRFLNLGKGGRRIEFAASLPARPIDDYLTAAERDRSTEEPPLATDKPRLRLMTEDDAVALARCIYRAYGYTYVDFIYYPDRIAEMLRAGLMMSCVAENDAGEIVGHLALLRNGPDSAIAESAIAVVDPRYRGHSLFKTMKVFMAEEGTRRGLLGLYSEAMTLHPFTQKGNIALGAHETGLVLAYVPGDVNTRKIEASPQGERAALLLYYMRTNQEPHRIIFAPPQHRTVLEDICRRIGLDRQFAELTEAPPSAEATRLDVKVRPDLGLATIIVRACGEDADQQVRHHLVDLCRRKIDAIYLDLPLADPASPRLCAACEAAGFFFAGMIPEYDGGDVLRLQYMNNLDIRMEGIVVVSDIGRQLFDHVASERQRVGEGARAVA
jgi:serine/threonine-protein kinase RsbW